MLKTKYILLGILILVVMMAAISVVAHRPNKSAIEQPAVVVAAAPVYPAVAHAAQLSGEVVVEVEIDSSGTVTSARTVEGHPLLRKVSESASLRWKFAPAETALSVRRVNLTFSFHKAENREAEMPPVFILPYKVEVTIITPCLY